MPAPDSAVRRALQEGARRSCFLGLVLLAGCARTPVDLTGKRCDAQRPCGKNYACNDAGTCDYTGPLNLVVNPGFENGTAGWTASNSSVQPTTPGRNSANAALWTPLANLDGLLSPTTPSLERPVKDAVYCARAWLKGDDEENVYLQSLENGTSADQDFVTLKGGTWRRAETRVVASGGTLSIALLSNEPLTALNISVDDVALWESVDGATCTEEP